MKILILANIPKELYLFDDSAMAEWSGDEVPTANKRKAMSYVTSRFWDKLTSGFELKTMPKAQTSSGTFSIKCRW